MSSMNFIYHPRSRDRVFAERPIAGMAWAKYPNGCRHVVGGVMIAVECANPGAGYWRQRAKALAGQIIAAVGGLAQDDCGTICFYVPRDRCVDVAKLLTAMEPGEPEFKTSARYKPSEPEPEFSVRRGLWGVSQSLSRQLLRQGVLAVGGFERAEWHLSFVAAEEILEIPETWPGEAKFGAPVVTKFEEEVVGVNT